MEIYVYTSELSDKLLNDWDFGQYLLDQVEASIKYPRSEIHKKRVINFLDGIKKKSRFPFEYLKELFNNYFNIPSDLEKYLVYGNVFNIDVFIHNGDDECEALKECLEGDGTALIYVCTEVFKNNIIHNFRAAHEDYIDNELFDMGIKKF